VTSIEYWGKKEKKSQAKKWSQMSISSWQSSAPARSIYK